MLQVDGTGGCAALGGCFGGSRGLQSGGCVVCGCSGGCGTDATCVPPYEHVDYSPLQLGAALQPLPERVYSFLSPFGLSHFCFTWSHFVSVVSPGWLTQVVLCDVIHTPDRPTGRAFDRFVRWTTCNDLLMSYLLISFLIVFCGPRAFLSSVSYPLDHRCAPFSSLYLLKSLTLWTTVLLL